MNVNSIVQCRLPLLNIKLIYLYNKEHVNFLSKVASHGFLIVAIGPMPKKGEIGSGRSVSSQMTDAINWAIAQNSDKKSPLFNRIDITKIEVSGMSCGGLQTLETAPDQRVTTTVPQSIPKHIK